MPLVLTVLYSVELWYLNEEMSFWSEYDAVADEDEGRKTERMMMPGRMELRIGAGESKVRNPRTRGCLVRTLAESLAIGFGVSFIYEQA